MPTSDRPRRKVHFDLDWLRIAPQLLFGVSDAYRAMGLSTLAWLVFDECGYASCSEDPGMPIFLRTWAFAQVGGGVAGAVMIIVAVQRDFDDAVRAGMVTMCVLPTLAAVLGSWTAPVDSVVVVAPLGDGGVQVVIAARF